MKRPIVLFLVMMCSLSIRAMDATMYQWKSHFAYGSITRVVDTGDRVFGLAGGALFSVNKQTEEIQTYSKQNGLNGGTIAQIAYDDLSQTLIIAYSDGLIDMMKDGTFTAMTDLQQKSITTSKCVNSIIINNGMAYFCMPFGVLLVDIQKKLIKDTYYIGAQGSDVNVLDLAIRQDSIFAISAQSIYSINRNDNLMDYRYWHCMGDMPTDSAYRAIAVWRDELFVIAKNTFAQRRADGWYSCQPDRKFNGMRITDDKLFLLSDQAGLFYVTDEFQIGDLPAAYSANDVAAKNSTYWLATSNNGIVRLTPNGSQSFQVDGPLVNLPYRLTIANNKLYMVAGQRWDTEDQTRGANIMIYDIQQDTWSNITEKYVDEKLQCHIFDLMNVAVDPNDPDHYFITTYGTGILECYGLDIINHFTCRNSSLASAAPGEFETSYVRTDGALFDQAGNLWILNAGVEELVHVANPTQLANARQTGQGYWFKMPLSFTGEQCIVHTPDVMFIDNRNSNWKWISSMRYTTGLILLDDNGTPQYSGDDEAIYRTTFVDQDAKTIKPEYIYAVKQDKNGTLWVALENGLITIPSTVDYKSSNACERIKIARNDGTGLADYLLETECISAIAVDGANRKWFGTKASGVYLISEDGEETIAHFTEDNSPLLSNNILSIAIDPQTGRVFIGTGKGLMSYQGDAANPFEDYSSAYAYPNPVHPDYQGVITITGLMDESVVNILDNAGNLVCKTRSNGGTAIWDGKTADGKRVASGVYSAYCNEENGNHALVKILVMH